MNVIKCTFTVILFTLIFNVNADPSTNSTITKNGTESNGTITTPPAASTTDPSSPITVTVTETLVTTTNATTAVPTKTTPSTVPSTVSTTASTTVNPVTTSKVTTTSPNTTEAPHHNRQFDGPSFIGGIVLATGLMAIGFVAFKFYKARTERNYHTL
ncbi:hypothetical protein RN001_006669 [Aquatica leii]|uniref:Sialomucin core protein 24 n=1 Tax=Aquatica leii TaxID=1421715 RepID=A0AAN7SSA6_9COLE|nr:hypothetical protein RN001_006669 [Aquatica leii]